MDRVTSERRRLQRFQGVRRALLALLIAIALAVLLVVRSALPEDVHEFVEAVGIGLIAAGILGRMWCTLYIGGRKADEVVLSGPYSISRNPLYFFSTVAACGVGAQTGSVTVAIVFALACAVAFHVVIRREERFLAEAFGEPYRAYLASVPRFLPRLSGFRTEETIVVRPARLHRTLMDGLVFFLAMPGLEAVELLQAAGAVPVIFRLY